ncbi:MAG: hypothetical protein U0U67_14620 [Chitinophagales bacterium]
MKKSFFSLIILLSFIQTLNASSLYEKDGIILEHFVTKEKTIFIPFYNRNVIIWKSKMDLINTNKIAIAVRIPCYLSYTYSYLNPAEISTIQDYVSDFTLSDVYKNYVAPKPVMVNAKQTITSEKYFATFDDIDLRSAVLTWNFKYSFWQ